MSAGGTLEGRHSLPPPLYPRPHGAGGRGPPPSFSPQMEAHSPRCFFLFFLTHPFLSPAHLLAELQGGGSKNGLFFPDPSPHRLPSLKLLAPNERLAGRLSLLPHPLGSAIGRRLCCCGVSDQSWHVSLRRGRAGPLGWPCEPPCPHCDRRALVPRRTLTCLAWPVVLLSA